MIPCVYCLTTKRDEILYKNIFTHLIVLYAIINHTFSPKRFTSDFELAAIQACLFKFLTLQSSQYGGKFRILVLSSAKESDNDEHKTADHWILAAIGLALIPSALVESTWVDIMDEYTPNDYRATSQFNDYISLARTTIWRGTIEE